MIYIGGAGIVAQHLKQLWGKSFFTSVWGDDDLKTFVSKEMKRQLIIDQYDY